MNSSLREVLNAGKTANVTFRKMDGTMREMTVTTNPANIAYESKGTGRTETPGVIRAWSIEDNGFRSIKEDNVIEFTVAE